MSVEESGLARLVSEILCAADSKWVLGHWYMGVLPNGRSLEEFTALAAFVQEELGHARALFTLLEELGAKPEGYFEKGRRIEDCQSMATLDLAPRSWGDFAVSMLVAESAVSEYLATFAKGANASAASLVTRIAEEDRYHLLCAHEWVRGIGAAEADRTRGDALGRIRDALSWFGPPADGDRLISDGFRTVDVQHARSSFVERVGPTVSATFGEELMSEAIRSTGWDGWDRRRRRHSRSVLPRRLWQKMVPTNEAAVLARGPDAGFGSVGSTSSAATAP